MKSCAPCACATDMQMKVEPYAERMQEMSDAQIDPTIYAAGHQTQPRVERCNSMRESGPISIRV